MRAASLAFALIACIGLAAISPPLSAQQAPKASSAGPSIQELGAAVSRYYEKPFDIPQFLADWERAGGIGREAMMGFLAGVFFKHPAEIQKATAAPNLGRQAQVIVIAGLRLADRRPEAIGAAAGWGWPQPQIATITPVLPLRQAKPEHPNSFDAFWSASFATGDEAYVRPIYAYYDSVASLPGVDVRDIVAMVVLRHRPNKDAMDVITKKYPQDTLVRIVYAASALWSLESNGRQHKFVAAALDRYAKEKPKSPATEGLAELRRAVEAARGAR